MEPDYDRMPVAEADRRIQEEISRHRERMGRLRRRRGQRLQLELNVGRSATEVAAEIGTSAQGRLRDAGVLVAYVGWQGQEMEAVFPREYADHALAVSGSPPRRRKSNQTL